MSLVLERIDLGLEWNAQLPPPMAILFGIGKFRFSQKGYQLEETIRILTVDSMLTNRVILYWQMVA